MCINLRSRHAVEINGITELCVTDFSILPERISLKSMRPLLCNLRFKNSQDQSLLLITLSIKSVKYHKVNLNAEKKSKNTLACPNVSEYICNWFATYLTSAIILAQKRYVAFFHFLITLYK